jgi:hypothetical protein
MDAEPNTEIYVAISTDGGKTFSPNRKVVSEVCPCCKTSAAAAPDGTLYIGWRQVLENGTRHIAITSSRDGGATFETPAIVSDDKWQIDACPVSGAALLAESGTAVKIAWYTAGEMGQPGLYTSQSADGGKTFSPRILVSNEASGGTPGIFVSPAGTFTVYSSSGTVGVKPLDKAATSIADAVYPAAAVSGSNLFVAFVRGPDDRRGVYVTAIPLK